MKTKIIFGLILALAFLLRVVGISYFPVGFTQDEAGLGYDAYSLLETGKDQWGNPWPLTLKSFGDYKLPLYSYLTIPSVFIFGLNEFSVRLPNAIVGTLAVIATYLMVYQISKRKDFALWAMAFLAVSPWHTGLSRGAFEANLTTFFLPFGVWAFIKGITSRRWMVLSALSFSLNLFSYHSPRFITPLIISIVVLSYRKEITDKFGGWVKFLKAIKWPSLLFAVFFLATIYSMFFGGAKRGLDITIFNPTDNWAAVSLKRYEGVAAGVPDSVARIFSNKVTYVVDLFLGNYLTYFSPSFLFTQGAGEWGYGMIPGRGVMYLFEIGLLIASAVSFIRKEGFNKMGLVLLWLAVAPTAAALTKGPGYAANRAAVMIPAIQILSAWGVVYLSDKLREKSLKVVPKVFNYVVLVILLFSFAHFLEEYLFVAPQKGSRAMQYGMRELMATIDSIEGNYDGVVLSRTLSVPNIWVQFYNKVDPQEVQRASHSWLRYETQGVKYLDQINEYSLGRYTFGDIIVGDLKGRNVLVVGRPSEFPLNTKAVASVNYLNGEEAFILVNANEF